MPSSSLTPIESRVVFVSGNEAYTVRDLIDSAAFRGQLEPIWQELARLVNAERLSTERDAAMDDSAIDAAAEAFRYEHELITAEETERWLQERGLTLADFSAYFVRHYWGDLLGDEVEPEPIDYFSAPNELRGLLTVELILSGELDRMARRLSWRVAVSAAAGRPDPQTLADERTLFFDRSGMDESRLSNWLEQLGRGPDWFRNAVAMEAIYRQRRDALLTDQAREREVSALRLPLTRFDVETIECDLLDAAREASLCVREDGMSMEEVAAEGRYPYRRTEVLLEEIPENLQQKFLNVSAGEILEPIPQGDGFHLCRVMGKAEPDLHDPKVKNRAEQRILERHFADLVARRIQWRNVANPP